MNAFVRLIVLTETLLSVQNGTIIGGNQNIVRHIVRPLRPGHGKTYTTYTSLLLNNPIFLIFSVNYIVVFIAKTLT